MSEEGSTCRFFCSRPEKSVLLFLLFHLAFFSFLFFHSCRGLNPFVALCVRAGARARSSVSEQSSLSVRPSIGSGWPVLQAKQRDKGCHQASSVLRPPTSHASIAAFHMQLDRRIPLVCSLLTRLSGQSGTLTCQLEH